MTDAIWSQPEAARTRGTQSPSTYPPPLAAGRSDASHKVLGGAAVAWFSVAIGGQAIFVLYILVLYVASLLLGDFEAWSRVMPKGLVRGDSVGNAAMIVHVLVAAAVMAGGALQLVPAIRNGYPRFHRWNGRIYLVTVVVASLAGLWMVWSRSQVGGLAQHIGMTVNAVIILVTAALVLRHAMARQFAAHRRWALRLFMVASGVWFFRVGLMFWIAVNGGPVGFDPSTFRGPALDILTYLQFLLPLALLELYFIAKERASRGARYSAAGVLLVATMAMGAGIAVATVGMWLPHMR